MSRTVSLCFDDGFLASAEKVDELFRARGLAACFAVLAAPELAQDAAIRASPVADWPFWRDMAAAGHAVEPHGFAHEHLGKLPLVEAMQSVERCLARWEAEIPGAQARSAVFHLPYLAAPVEVVTWLGRRALGVRMAVRDGGLNDPAALTRGGPVNCMTFGPDRVDEAFTARVRRFVESEDGWLVVVLHGLDGEGWGTISEAALAGGVDRLLAAGVAVRPPSTVLRDALASS